MKYLRISLIVMLLLILSVESFSETERERLFRIVGVKTEEQKAIEELDMKIDRFSIEIKKLKNDIDELRNEILSINRKLYYLEFRNK